MEPIPKSQRKQIKAIAIDMWPLFLKAAERMVPKKDIVFDTFHVSKHLNEALDTISRQEQKRSSKGKTIQSLVNANFGFTATQLKRRKAGPL